MLAKRYRLQVQTRARERGRLQRGRFLFLKTLPASSECSKFAVIVPASVLPKATARNSLKRKLYDSLSPRCKMQPYKDVVITVQGAARNAPIHAILEELSVLLG